MRLGSNQVWNPTHEPSISLAFWLAHYTNVTVESEGIVSHWSQNKDGSTARWSQETEAKQPTLSEQNGALGGVDFSGDDYLYGNQITLGGEYVLGIKFKVEDATASNDVIVGDIDQANNFIRLNDENTIGLKHSSGQKTFNLNNTSYFTAETHHHLVVGRDSSDDIFIWVDGVKQTATANAGGDFLLDGMGARNSGGTGTNFFQGVVFELVVFNNLFSDDLAERLSGHLMSLKID